MIALGILIVAGLLMAAAIYLLRSGGQPVKTEEPEAAPMEVLDLAQGKHPTAATIAAYEKYAATGPDQNLKVQAHYLCGQYYYDRLEKGGPQTDGLTRNSMAEKVEKHFTHMSLLDMNHPNRDEALFAMAAVAYFERSDFDKARILYEKIMQEHPSSKWIKICEDRLELIRSSHPAHTSALKLYAQTEKAFEQARFGHAIRLLDDVIRQHPASPLMPLAYFFLGDIFQYKQNNIDAALAAYEKVHDGFPEHRYAAQASFKRAECLRKHNRHREAVPAYELFLRRYGHRGYSDYAQYYIGQCYEELQDLQAAAAAYRALLANFPESIWVAFAKKRMDGIARRTAPGMGGIPQAGPG